MTYRRDEVVWRHLRFKATRHAIPRNGDTEHAISLCGIRPKDVTRSTSWRAGAEHLSECLRCQRVLEQPGPEQDQT